MAIYDYQGNEITEAISDEQVRNAFMGAVADGTIVVGTNIGDTLGLATHLFNETYVNNAYASLLSAYKTHPNSIPFFVHSDQHGRGVEIQRYTNNLDVDGLEYANMNLGDTVVDTYGSDVLESVYQRIKYVKNYIGIPGNHEHKPSSTEDPEKYMMRRAFCTTNLVRQMISTDPADCYVAYQPLHAVKYICLDFYDHWNNNGSTPYVTNATGEWLVNELSRDDGNDIVILEHDPPFAEYKNRGDTEYTTRTYGGAELNFQNQYNLYLARKNKTSGIYVDNDGNEHPYDFTGYKSNLLCVIGGHWHEERYLDKDGVTVYVQDWAGDNKYGGSFGLIDRESGLLKIFRFDNVNGVYPELDITLQMS